jgi:hypothetical protein
MVPANAVIHAKLKKGTVLTVNGYSSGVYVTAQCTSVTATGKTPADGLEAPLFPPPKFGGCSGSLGGTDTLTSSGKWSVTLNSSGTAGNLVVPRDGIAFSSSILPTCVIEVSPNGKTKVPGTYNDKNTLTITNVSIPVAPSPTSSCTFSPTAQVSLTLVVSPDVSVEG